MSATLKDVANLAGVSTATVSYVLNNGPRPVRPETRALVLNAIEQLDYRPRRKRKNNASAKNLTVGVIVPNANSTFFGIALEEIEQFFYKRGYTCIISSSHSDLAREKKLIHKLTRLVDGLIITPTAQLYPAIEQLPGLGVPVVVMDRQISATNLNGVGIDNYSIAVKGVHLLFDAGYRKIALVNGPDSIDTMQARVAGYKDALADLDLPFNPDWLREIPFTVEAGRNAALDLMSLHNHPDAIICTIADESAGVLLGLNQLGVRLPDDVAFVCYGDTIWSPLISPAVTVIDAPAGVMGETSARLLLNCMSDPSITETKHILLEPKLILRNSHRRQRSSNNRVYRV